MASWSAIPSDVLVLIVTYLQCFADRMSVAGVCPEWRAAVRHLVAQPPRYQHLPWLLMPSPTKPWSFASLLSGARHEIPLRKTDFRRRADRVCGSHEGGWLAFAAGFEGPYALVNLFSSRRHEVPLPRKLELSLLPRLLIRMITLSDKPTAQNCIAAAHLVVFGDAPSIAFCRPRVDRRWVRPPMDVGAFQDTLYYNGEVYQGFYAINDKENLFVFVPCDINAATLVMRQVAFSVEPRVPCLLTDMYRTRTSVNRYLVESRGKLLMVVRHSGGTKYTPWQALHFEVFEMVVKPLPDAGHSASWVELQDLDDRMLFIGKGCSRAFEAGQWTGFQGGSIYFLDDAGAAKLYSTMFIYADIGTYSMGKRMIVRPGLRSPSPALHANDQGSSYSLYGPRDLVVRTGNGSHATMGGSSLQIVRDIDNTASDSEKEVAASVWPFSSGSRGHSIPPIWFLPSTNE